MLTFACYYHYGYCYYYGYYYYYGLYCYFTDIDECMRDDACSAGFVCTNTVGSYTCTCSTGYIQDGDSCVRKYHIMLRAYAMLKLPNYLSILLHI